MVSTNVFNRKNTFGKIYYDIIVVTYCTISILCALELCLPTEFETEKVILIPRNCLFGIGILRDKHITSLSYN